MAAAPGADTASGGEEPRRGAARSRSPSDEATHKAVLGANPWPAVTRITGPENLHRHHDPHAADTPRPHMTVKRWLRGWTMAVFLTLLSACGGSGSGSGDAEGSPSLPTTPIPAGIGIVGPLRVNVGAALQWRAEVPAGVSGLSYEWRFGDGTTSTDPAPTHRYGQAGTYDMALRVRNAAGQTVEAHRQVQAGSFAMVEGLSCTGANASGWCWQQPQPDGNEGRDGVFVDARQGWIVGDQGLVLHTVDGGSTWTRQSVPTVASLRKLAFRDARDLLAVAAGGQVIATRDGGVTWTLLGVAPVVAPQRIWLRDRHVVVVAGVNALQQPTWAISRDGGSSWGTIAPPPMPFDAIDFDGVLWGIAPGRPLAEYPGRALSDYGAGPAAPWPAAWPTGANLLWIDAQDSGFAWALLDSSTGTLLSQRATAGAAWNVRHLQLPADATGYRISNGWLSPDGRGLVRAYLNGQASDTRYARTRDGGATWTWVPLPLGGLSLVDELTLVDGRTLWGRFTDANGATQLLLSTDGGEHWTAAFAPVAAAGYYTLDIRRDPAGGLLAQAKSDVRQWFRSVDDGASWSELPAGSGPDQATAGLWFDGTGRGLRLTATGTAYDTADQGRHWTARAAPLGAQVRSVRIGADGRGWMVADRQLSQTHDGGRSWTAISPPELAGNDLSLHVPIAVLWTDGPRLRVEAEFRCPRPGMCGRALFASDDAGLTWSLSPGYSPGVEPGYAGPDVVVRGSGASVLRSSDGGMSWVQVSSQAGASATRVVFQDASNGWIVGSSTTAWRTRDGGLTWTPVALPVPLDTQPEVLPVYRDIALADALRGWMVGVGGAILATQDGGATWVRQPSGTARDLNRISVGSAFRVWIGGTGVTLATVSGGQIDP